MYDAALSREDKNNRYMKEIHEMAVKGESLHSAMGTEMPLPSWDDILIMGAQLNPMPLNDQDPVSLTTLIGKKAKQPLVLESPVYISHMSFGALSKEIKVALAKGSSMAKTAIISSFVAQEECKTMFICKYFLIDVSDSFLIINIIIPQSFDKIKCLFKFLLCCLFCNRKYPFISPALVTIMV